MKKIVVVVLLLAFSGAVAGRQAPKVQGKYECSGSAPDGSRYQFPLVVKTHGDNFYFFWEKSPMVGIGILSKGDLVVGIVNHANDSPIVVVYEVRAGQLNGIWAGGDGKIYKESCLVSGLVRARGGFQDGSKDTPKPSWPSKVSSL